MDRRKATLVAALAATTLAASAAAFWGARSSERAPAAPTAAQHGAAVERFSWPAGKAYTYGFEWTLDTHAQAEGAAPVDGAMDLSADLELRSLGAGADGTTAMVASVHDVRRHALTVMGTDMMPDEGAVAATFDGHEAWVDVGPRGAVKDVRFRKDAPALFKRLVHAVVTQSEVTLAGNDQAAWTAEETSVDARAELRYEVDAEDPQVLHRTLGRLVALTAFDPKAVKGGVPLFRSRAEIALDPAGHVASLRAEEAAAVGTTLEDAPMRAASRLTFTLRRVDAFDPAEAQAKAPRADDPAVETRLPGERFAEDDADEARARAERLARDVGREEILATLHEFSAGQKLDLHFMTRGAARLRAHPEDIAAVEREWKKLPQNGRVLAVELLASTQTLDAQAAMRRLVDSPEARADRQGFGRMIQRFGFVERPDRATLAFLATEYDARRAAGDAELLTGVTRALGAAIGHAYWSGVDRPYAAAGHARLVKDLDAEQDAGQRQALVSALGNAGMREGLAPILARAADDDPGMRAQVARALRRYDVDDAHEALFALVLDPTAPAALDALRTLDEFDLTASDLQRLAEVAPRARGDVDAALVSLAAKFASRDVGAAARILEVVAGRTTNEDLAARARSALAALPRG